MIKPQTSRRHLQLWRLCALSPPEDIDLDVLLSVPDLLPIELATAATQPLDRERVIGVLTRRTSRHT